MVDKCYRYETSRTGNYTLLREKAKENRRCPTHAEAALWQYLRGRNLGVRFRRQHPIGDYIVDFVCLEAKLVVEVDGKYHLQPDVAREDKIRERFLEQEGFQILRFTNDEVLCDPGKVALTIKQYMDSKHQSPQKAHPSFGGAGGGLIIFSAPSGSGKSTIINWLMTEHPELGLAFSISCTSRAPRGTEQDGVEYFFLTPQEFRQRIADGEFLEYEEVYEDRFYGTLKSQVERQAADGQNVVFDVDVKGGCNIKDYYGARALSIFIQPPSVDELRRRLLGRGTDSAEQIEQRLAKAEYEMTFAPRFDRIVVNDDLATAQAEVLRLIREFLSPTPEPQNS